VVVVVVVDVVESEVAMYIGVSESESDSSSGIGAEVILGFVFQIDIILNNISSNILTNILHASPEI